MKMYRVVLLLDLADTVDDIDLWDWHEMLSLAVEDLDGYDETVTVESITAVEG